MVSDFLASVSPSTLRGARYAWDRWVRWCRCRDDAIAVLPAAAVHVKLFLVQVRQGFGNVRRNAGGACTVQGVFVGLHFLEQHLGFQIDLGHVNPAEVVPVALGSRRESPPYLPHDIVVFATLKTQQIICYHIDLFFL